MSAPGKNREAPVNAADGRRGLLQLEIRGKRLTIVETDADDSPAAEVLQALEAARAQGVRTAFLRVADCWGGRAGAGVLLYSEFERFREEGGLVAAFVAGSARSAAVPPLLGADVVMMAPGAYLAVHRPVAADGTTLLPADAVEFQEIVAMIAKRTLVSEADARRMLLWTDDAGQPQPVWIDARTACEQGFADFVGTDEDARRLVANVAAGQDFTSVRRTRMAARGSLPQLGPALASLRERAAKIRAAIPLGPVQLQAIPLASTHKNEESPHGRD